MKVTLFRTCDSRNKNYPFVCFNREYKGYFSKDFESLDALAKYLSKTRCVSVVPRSMSVKDRVTLFKKVRSLSI